MYVFSVKRLNIALFHPLTSFSYLIIFLITYHWDEDTIIFMITYHWDEDTSSSWSSSDACDHLCQIVVNLFISYQWLSLESLLLQFLIQITQERPIIMPGPYKVYARFFRITLFILNYLLYLKEITWSMPNHKANCLI